MQPLDRLKKIMLRNYAMSLLAYHIALLVSYLLVYFNLSSYGALPFHILLVAIYTTNSAILWINLSKSHISKRFSNRMLMVQIINWMLLNSIWIFFMAEFRSVTLICAMMVLAFLFAYSSFFYSLFLTLVVSVSYLGVSYLGIEYFSQRGNLQVELIYVTAFFFSSMLVARVLHRLSKLLRDKASNDYLTKLLNRRAMSKAIDSEFSRCKRTQTDASIVMIDLDDFKQINDNYGHQGGDKVLVEVAGLLKAQLRDIDYVGRWGGEEFILLLIGSQRDQAKTVVERVRTKLQDMTIEHKDHSFKVTFSAGIAQALRFDSAESCIIEADKHLYKAKHEGKNRVAC